MIPQRDLSLLSNRLAERGGRRISEAVLERDDCLSWVLVGLSQSPLKDRLAFKGGTALKKCYFEDYRFSEDLDFTMIEETGVVGVHFPGYLRYAVCGDVEAMAGGIDMAFSKAQVSYS